MQFLNGWFDDLRSRGRCLLQLHLHYTTDSADPHWTLCGDGCSDQQSSTWRGRSANRVPDSSTCKKTWRQRSSHYTECGFLVTLAVYFSPRRADLKISSMLLRRDDKNIFLYFGISRSPWKCHLESFFFFFNAPKCCFDVCTWTGAKIRLGDLSAHRLVHY